MSYPITVTGSYTQRDVIPPRCRTPRDITVDAEPVTVHIPTVTAEDAPLAFRMPLEHATTYTTPTQAEAHEPAWTREIRSHNGTLWAPLLHQTDGAPAPLTPDSLWPHGSTARPHEHEWDVQTQDAWEAITREELETEYLIIDGTLWQAAPEPGYYILTFGLGNNHGGTGLFACGGNATPAHAHRIQFTAAEYDEAVAAACDTATRRGDNQSIEGLRATPRIEVLDPKQVRLVTPAHEAHDVAEARDLFRGALRDYREHIDTGEDTMTAQEEQEAWENLARLRQRILTAGGADIPGHAASTPAYRA